MKKESLYLDTSVPSAYYDARVKGRMEATQRFWHDVLPLYEPHVSEITVQELADTRDEHLRRRFRELIKSFKILKTNQVVRKLANVYIVQGIFPEKYLCDASLREKIRFT